MTGQKAENFLEDFELGSSLEGFTEYDGKDVCVSANASDGRTLLYIVPECGYSYAQLRSVLMVLSVLSVHYDSNAVL